MGEDHLSRSNQINNIIQFSDKCHIYVHIYMCHHTQNWIRDSECERVVRESFLEEVTTKQKYK